VSYDTTITCVARSNSIAVDLITSVRATTLPPPILVDNGVLDIGSRFAGKIVTLYNSLGAMVDKSVVADNGTVPISDAVPRGVYFVTIGTDVMIPLILHCSQY